MAILWHSWDCVTVVDVVTESSDECGLLSVVGFTELFEAKQQPCMVQVTCTRITEMLSLICKVILLHHQYAPQCLQCDMSLSSVTSILKQVCRVYPSMSLEHLEAVDLTVGVCKPHGKDRAIQGFGVCGLHVLASACMQPPQRGCCEYSTMHHFADMGFTAA